MESKQRIDQFNQKNPPFYIVDHEDGEYSLCLPLDMLSDKYYPYCQGAFDAYAAEIGEPACSQNGLKTHGSGYEWEARSVRHSKTIPILEGFSLTVRWEASTAMQTT